jgi:hypothetical protein
MRNGSGSVTSTKKRFDEYSHLSYEPFSESDAVSDIKFEDETNTSDSNSEDIGISKPNEFDDLTSDDEHDTCKSVPIQIPSKSSNIKKMVR